MWRSIFYAALLLLLARGAQAGPRLSREVVDRASDSCLEFCPESKYAALGVDFIADGPEVTLVVTVRNRDGTDWLTHRIDNVSVVEVPVHQANLAGVGEFNCCIFEQSVLFHFFEVDPSDVVFLEQFGSGVPPEWDLSNGAYWEPSSSAPNAFDPVDFSGGSLALGAESNPAEYVSTSVTIGGLTPGTDYHLSFWWHADFDFDEEPDIEVELFGTEFWVDVTTPPLDDARIGSGLSWADYDGDGDDDLFVANQAGTDKLFRNDGGSFADVTPGAFSAPDNSIGAVWGDYDNDGDLDLFIARFLDPDRLFRNDGAAFVNVTPPLLDDSGPATGVAWADFNNDGYLDLYLGQAGAPNRLYQNVGGLFSDATSPPLDNGGSLNSLACADFDGDGDQDIYIANNGQSNKLFRNDGSMTFVDVSIPPLSDNGNAVGVAWADYDNDLDLDLYIANIPINRLLRNDGSGNFVDVADQWTAGPGPPDFSIAPAWGDYDNDGDQDLYYGNGPGAPNKLLRNDGTNAFVDAGSTPLEDTENTYGAAFDDYDGDGDLDMYVVNSLGPNKLVRNDTTVAGHWLRVRLVGTQSNRSAIGARVTVLAGGVTQIRELSAGSGHTSQEPLAVHFGLGNATMADNVKVRWPSGVEEYFITIPANGTVTLTEGGGVVSAPAPTPRAVLLEANVPNPFNPTTTIRYHVPVATSGNLTIYDVAGRVVRELVPARRIEAGSYRVEWDGRDGRGWEVGSGVYIYQLVVGELQESRRMVLIR